MNIIIVKNYKEMSIEAAKIIADEIKRNPKCKLGLATGSTPIGTYTELINMYKRNEISFKQVTTYNLDEYVGLCPNNNQSYQYFMNDKLFNHVDIIKENCFIPNGMAYDLEEEAIRYESILESVGYTDIQILGIGENGHIAFNEPADTLKAPTNIVELTKETIEANSRFFDHVDDVPKKAISMGLKGIMMSNKILLLASGENKAKAIANMLSGEISTSNPASFLNLHKNVTVILDKSASSIINKKTK